MAFSEGCGSRHREETNWPGKQQPGIKKDAAGWVKGPDGGAILSFTLNVAHEHYGFFVLISNEVKNPVTALSLYRMRDVVKKVSWNVKERLKL